jgi:hypothetical protein
MLLLLVFFSLITSAFASLEDLVAASRNFSIAIQQQLAAFRDPSPSEFAERTISYADAKTAYYTTLRAAVPELISIATGKEARPAELDAMTGIFSGAGEKQEKIADKETADLLSLLSGNPDIERATVEFERAQKLEAQFHIDFDGQDFTSRGSILHRNSNPSAAVNRLV